MGKTASVVLGNNRPESTLSLSFILDQPTWYGAHSGYYAQLPRAFASLGHDIRITTPTNCWMARCAGKLVSVLCGLPRRRQTLTIDELRFHLGWLWSAGTIGIVLGIEHHLPGLRYWRRAPPRLIGTIHHPRVLWTDEQLDDLRRLSSAVVLYRADLDFFSDIVGEGRVRFVYHGVDTEYFKPGDAEDRKRWPPLILSVGHFGRDVAQLERVVPPILEQVRDAEFCMVAARFAQVATLASALRGHPRVRFMSDLPDEDLRNLYQRATVLLLPISEAGANNAIVEALACGLPIVSTEVGGIRDYGGGTIFPLAHKSDDSELIELTVDLLQNEPRCAMIGRREREFAVSRLRWPQVAAAHAKVYRELASFV